MKKCDFECVLRKMVRKSVILVVFLAILSGVCLAQAEAAAKPLSTDGEAAAPLSTDEKAAVGQINNVFRRATEQVRPAVVSVSVTKNGDGPNGGGGGSGLGSGCIIDKKGYIVTNNHVVEDTDEVVVKLADGRHFKAEEIMLDPDTDLAVIRIDTEGADIPAATFGDSDDLQVGDFVLAIGNPFGLEHTVTAGIVSFKGRHTQILGRWGYENFIQTDADINKGNSGGPLVNLYGEVIGINSNILSPTGQSAGYGFAVPSNLTKSVTEQLIRDKVIKRGYLGVSLIGSTLAELRDKPAKELPDGRAIKLVLEDVPADVEGVLVNEVTEGTPAEEGGMKDFDIVTKIDGEKMTSSNELRNFVGRMAPGTTVKCTVWRDGKEIELSIKLGDREEGKKQVAKAEEAERPRIQGMPWPWGGGGEGGNGGNGGNGPFEFRWPPQGGDGGGRMIPYGDEPQESRGAKLGISVEPMTKELAVKFGYPENLHGLVITRVINGSVAQSSGLKEGDIIVEVNDIKIKPNEDGMERLKRFIGEADFDDEGLSVLVRDKDGERKVEVKRRGKEL